MKIKKVATEQAQRRADAIITCMDLGDLFIQHFHKIYKEGKSSASFSHHCQEMQAWLDKCRKIKLQSTKKYVTSENLVDWFFTAGGLIDEDNGFYNYDEMDVYNSFMSALAANRDLKVIDIANQLLDY